MVTLESFSSKIEDKTDLITEIQEDDMSVHVTKPNADRDVDVKVTIEDDTDASLDTRYTLVGSVGNEPWEFSTVYQPEILDELSLLSQAAR